jgi:hypothetical protein
MVKYSSLHNSPFALRTPCRELHQHLTHGSSIQHALDDRKMENQSWQSFTISLQMMMFMMMMMAKLCPEKFAEESSLR